MCKNGRSRATGDSGLVFVLIEQPSKTAGWVDVLAGIQSTECRNLSFLILETESPWLVHVRGQSAVMYMKQDMSCRALFLSVPVDGSDGLLHSVFECTCVCVCVCVGARARVRVRACMMESWKATSCPETSPALPSASAKNA